MRIDIWSDVVCPFCFLGKKRLDEALAAWDHADAVEVVWHSFELDPNAPKRLPESLVDHIASKYRTTPAQAQASQEAIAAQFDAAGGTFDWQHAQPGNTFDAHRVFHFAVDQGKGEQVMAALMRGYFAEGAVIGDPATLVDLATSAGLDADQVRDVLESDAYADAVRADEAAAQQIGISGVPFFVFDGRLAVSGAQPAEVMTEALNQAWRTREVALQPVGAADDSSVCGPEGCSVDAAANQA